MCVKSSGHSHRKQYAMGDVSVRSFTYLSINLGISWGDENVGKKHLFDSDMKALGFRIFSKVLQQNFLAGNL